MTSEDRESEFTPAAGRRLGRYELVTRIARGGMAEVWVARQRGELGFSRLVALKMIRAEYGAEASFRTMFLDEARVAARLHHANAAQVLDLGEQDGVLYLAMEYVEGDSVAGLVTRLAETSPGDKGLPAGVCVRILADACAGLHAAHELTDDDGRPLDLVHRDVSPHNVLVGVDGVARLTDFGIAKALGRITDDTETGQVKGKLSYLSPEQAKRLPPDRRSDVFAAGIVLWEMLTGERLFRGEDVADTLLNIASKPVRDPRELVDVPASVAEVTLRALSRDPAARYQTADDMRRALETAARSAGLRATSDEVADLVKDLALPQVERRRTLARQSLHGAGKTPLPREVAGLPPEQESTLREGRRQEPTSTRTSSVVPKVAPSETPPAAAAASRGRRAVVGVAAVAALAVVVVVATSGGRTSVSGDHGAVAGAPSAPEPAAPRTTPTTPDVVPTAAAVPGGSSAPSAAGTSSGAAAGRPPPSARPVTPPAPSGKPKYDNPYAP